MTDIKRSGEAMESINLTVTIQHHWFLWWVGDGLGRHIHGGTHRPLQARQ